MCILQGYQGVQWSRYCMEVCIAMAPLQLQCCVLLLPLVSPFLFPHGRASSCTDCDGGNVTCVDGVCLPRCVNVTLSGVCLQCQDSRFYGKQCENVCNDTCHNSRCQLNNSRVECTEGCVAGKRAANCGVDCPTSCTQCERYGERCVGPCKSPQYYDDYCSTPCPSGCRDGCDKDTGECDSCTLGQRGRNCNVTCPMNCRDGCDRDSGGCDTCKTGYAGRYCNVSCSPHCRYECDRDTGVCDDCSPNCPDDTSLATVGIILTSAALSGILVLTVVLYWKKRRNRKVSKSTTILQDDDFQSINKTDTVIRIGDIMSSMPCHKIAVPSKIEVDDKNHVEMCRELTGEHAKDLMKTEFNKLPPPDIREASYGTMAENFGKNRYKDMLPFDETKVVLETEGVEDSDYINASYINGYSDMTYVATQGPVLHAVDDFWRMIWQLETTKIVMLTNLVEAGKVKCTEYWPDCLDTQAYGRLCVQCVEEKVYQFYTLRTLAVWKENAPTRTVRQFHFTAWPDHGVPEETKSIIDFHSVVMDTEPNSLGPMVVHCSAGVGRTGTFLAFDYLMDLARKEGRVCVYKCVEGMRFQRMKMVQKNIQYTFLYDMLVDALQFNVTSTVRVLCERCWENEDKILSN